MTVWRLLARPKWREGVRTLRRESYAGREASRQIVTLIGGSEIWID